jgi:hypothetical protein
MTKTFRSWDVAQGWLLHALPPIIFGGRLRDHDVGDPLPVTQLAQRPP